jgi:enoyl-CoA hydratase/carnithine racemase
MKDSTSTREPARAPSQKRETLEKGAGAGRLSRIAVADISRKDGGTTRVIELSRPEKLNCLSLAMLDSLLAALQSSGQADCLVLTGAGRSFCAGIDLNEIGGPNSSARTGAKEHVRRLVDIYRWFLTTKSHTIALARGYAAGGGTGLIAGARTVLVASDFRFKLPGGTLARLASVALPMINLRAGAKSSHKTAWLGREYDAASAKNLGLVDHVVSLEYLAQLIERARKGESAPEFQERRAPSRSAVKRTLSELDQFMASFRA